MALPYGSAIYAHRVFIIYNPRAQQANENPTAAVRPLAVRFSDKGYQTIIFQFDNLVIIFNNDYSESVVVYVFILSNFLKIQ